MEQRVRIQVGRKSRPVTLIHRGNRIYFKFGFWRPLINEIKMMEGRRWHGFDDPPVKMWSIPKTQRNMFQLRFLMGENIYANWQQDPKDFKFNRPVYEHQKDMASQGLTYHYQIWAAEMGTGKTLASIELAENALNNINEGFWYIGPKSAIVSVRYEFKKWNAKFIPNFMTYEALVKAINNWGDQKAPKLVVFDESSRVKNPGAQRSQAAKQLADGVRADWGGDGYVILMSGSPAPKSPLDWWHQCEIAWPGFLVEGNIHAFHQRLGIIEEKENPITGGKYPHLVAWRDSENRCDACGEFKDHEIHNEIMEEGYHVFKPTINEVAKLYRRMRGLVLVKFKKDCLDLPEKQYRIIELPPSPSMKRAAELIVKSSPTAIRGLTLLRELSDGFQYRETQIGEETCPECAGSGEAIIYVDDNGDPVVDPQVMAKESIGTCTVCNGKKTIPKYKRETSQVPTPKIDALKEQLDLHDDIGRLVVYAGFTGSIDRVTETCHQLGWSTIRVDGRGWLCETDLGEKIDEEPVKLFQDLLETHPKVCFIGHPGSAGMGLTLTASPTVVYYSNDFNAESRIQSEDRIHRPGMDHNRGATIIDFIHLDTDKYVLDNLKKKRKLQAISLGEFKNIINDSVKDQLETR